MADRGFLGYGLEEEGPLSLDLPGGTVTSEEIVEDYQGKSVTMVHLNGLESA